MSERKIERKRITIRVDPTLLADAHNALAYAQDHDDKLTMQDLFDKGLELVVAHLQGEHNMGHPFPKNRRKVELKRGPRVVKKEEE